MKHIHRLLSFGAALLGWSLLTMTPAFGNTVTQGTNNTKIIAPTDTGQTTVTGLKLVPPAKVASLPSIVSEKDFALTPVGPSRYALLGFIGDTTTTGLIDPSSTASDQKLLSGVKLQIQQLGYTFATSRDIDLCNERYASTVNNYLIQARARPRAAKANLLLLEKTASLSPTSSSPAKVTVTGAAPGTSGG